MICFMVRNRPASDVNQSSKAGLQTLHVANKPKGKFKMSTGRKTKEKNRVWEKI